MVSYRNAQTAQSALDIAALPIGEFFGGDGVALTGIVHRQQAAADRSNQFGFAACDPAYPAGLRQVRWRQNLAIGSNNITAAFYGGIFFHERPPCWPPPARRSCARHR